MTVLYRKYDWIGLNLILWLTWFDWNLDRIVLCISVYALDRFVFWSVLRRQAWWVLNWIKGHYKHILQEDVKEENNSIFLFLFFLIRFLRKRLRTQKKALQVWAAHSEHVYDSSSCLSGLFTVCCSVYDAWKQLLSNKCNLFKCVCECVCVCMCILSRCANRWIILIMLVMNATLKAVMRYYLLKLLLHEMH